MNPRLKKLVGTLGIIVFLILYVSLAVAIADRLPDHPAIDLIYFLVVGVAWGLPLIPLMNWMNRDGPKK